MPTAAKLIAALAFTFVGFFAAEATRPYLGAGTRIGIFSYVLAWIGLLCGWFVMGGLAGKGYRSAAGSGVRVSATIVFWALILFSTYEMMLRATKLRYDGPMEALAAILSIAMDYSRLLFAPDVLVVLIIGGALAGALTEWGARRWS